MKSATRMRAVACALAVMAGPSAFASGYGSDYVGALLGEQLREELRVASRLAPQTSKASRPTEAAGPRSWNPSEQSPWANAYGTPAASLPPRATVSFVNGWRPVRLCACYLPADARSWDGGPLTEADIARLCRAQCY